MIHLFICVCVCVCVCVNCVFVCVCVCVCVDVEWRCKDPAALFTHKPQPATSSSKYVSRKCESFDGRQREVMAAIQQRKEDREWEEQEDKKDKFVRQNGKPRKVTSTYYIKNPFGKDIKKTHEYMEYPFTLMVGHGQERRKHDFWLVRALARGGGGKGKQLKRPVAT
jgi:hypothetical protein